MAKKYTKGILRRVRKNVKPSASIENQFITSIVKYVNSQIGTNIKKAKNLADIEIALSYVKLPKLDRFINKLGVDILNRNRKGYSRVMDSMVQSLAKSAKKRREELLFKETVNSLSKEKKIFEPLLTKFNQNMQLIKKIPDEVAILLREAYLKGEGLRGTEIEELLTEKLQKRARLIVRTESSKLNTALTEVRAKSVGLKAYIWSASGDARVRPSHQMVDNVLFFWDDTPSLDKMVGHAGEYPNDRCVPLPVFDLDDIKFPVKVANNLMIESTWNKQKKQSEARITNGSIKTYTKEKFISTFKNLFLPQ